MLLPFSEKIRAVPVMRVLAATVAGIIAGRYAGFPVNTGMYIIGILVLSGIVISRFNLFFGIYHAWIRGIHVSLLFIFLSWYNYSARLTEPVSYPDSVFIGQVSSLPVEKDRSVLVRMRVIRVVQDSQVSYVPGYVNVYFEKNDTLLRVRPGDTILFYAGVNVPVNTGNPDEFDYAAYLRSQSIYHQAWVSRGEWNWQAAADMDWRYIPLYMKHRLLQRISDTPGNKDAKSVLAAITLGTRDYLDPELKSAWANAGGIHVMAVSGLHVGMIWMVLGWMTVFLRYRKSTRIIRFLVVVSILWFYAALTGLSPSVTRSCLMFSLVSSGKLIDRNSDTINTVLVAAFIQLWLKPLMFFDAGFRFSYLAVLGILLFHERLVSLVGVKGWLATKVRDLAAVSISAQLLTFPLAVYYFHQLPAWFLLTNFLVIPLVTILVMTYLVSVVFFFLPALSMITTKACIVLTGIMNDGIGFIESLPASVIGELSLNPVQVAMLIFLPLIILAFFIYKKPGLLIAAQCLLLLVIITGIIRHVVGTVDNALIVYNTRKLAAVSVIENGKHIIFTDTSVFSYKAGVEYAGSGYWSNHFINKPVYYDFAPASNTGENILKLPGTRNILVLTSEYSLVLISDCRFFASYTAGEVFDTDFLVFTGSGVAGPGEIGRFFNAGYIIISSSMAPWNSFDVENCEFPVPVFDVRSSGGFVFRPDVKRQVKK